MSVLTRIAGGADGAMDECLGQYGGLVWSIARRICRDSAEAEDAVQDAFVAIWKSAERFDSSKSSEKTFVAMIARRRIIDRQRAAGRRPNTSTLEEDIPMASQSANSANALELQEEAQRARKMMTHLREDERRVLELAVDGGLSQSEISQRTGLPLGTVKTHARRGLIRLREMLAEPDGIRAMKGGA